MEAEAGEDGIIFPLTPDIITAQKEPTKTFDVRMYLNFAQEKVQFHDSTDSLVQDQLKYITQRKPKLVYIEILYF